jgi:tetratricopeptide (TPR) repeat protein
MLVVHQPSTDMTVQRTRRRMFDAGFADLRPAMHWLWKRGVPRTQLVELFKRGRNYISVSVHNEEIHEGERRKTIEMPGMSGFLPVEADLDLPEEKTEYAVREEQVQHLEVTFWRRVGHLDGILELGKLLRKLSKPGVENTGLLRLRYRLKHLTAETYLHAGYARSAQRLCDEASAIQLDLYKQTRSREELQRHAKTLILRALASTMREEWTVAWKTLRTAWAAFDVAGVPVDPEVYRQRAWICASLGEMERARKYYQVAFERFPAHREYLGRGVEDHSRYDVGQRPLAVLDGSLEAAERNLEIAEAWPAADIHRAINLNWAAAAAYRSDAAQAELRAEELLVDSRRESHGFGHQMTICRLLELTPMIPRSLRKDWVIFALQYNAYRNK